MSLGLLAKEDNEVMANKDKRIKWSVTEVSQATGLSEGAIGGYFSNRGITVKGGITLSQILEVINASRRNCNINNSAKVRTLVRILQAAGYSTPYDQEGSHSTPNEEE